MRLITEEDIKNSLPDQIKGRGINNKELANTINNVAMNEEEREAFKENFISYTSVLNDGKFKIDSYINAVKYVTYKLLGCSNIQAYTKVFPDKMIKWREDKLEEKDIAAYVSAFNKTILVNRILEQTLVPSWILNNHIYQKAINIQAELMLSAKSEKVRSDAANSLLTHLKPPETTRIELDIGSKSNLMDDLRNTTLALAEQQRKLLESNVLSLKEVAHSKIVYGERIDE